MKMKMINKQESDSGKKASRPSAWWANYENHFNFSFSQFSDQSFLSYLAYAKLKAIISVITYHRNAAEHKF